MLKTSEITHQKGRHCASTGLRNLMHFHHIPWSEALCFGIGAGLGLWYFHDKTTPTPLFHLRSSDIEAQFFTRIGLSFKWKEYDTPDDSESDLCSILDKDIPVILQTDIYYLPYFNTKVHFPGHVINVWACDPNREIYIITDTDKDQAFELAFEDLKKARFYQSTFFNSKGNIFAPEKINPPENLTDVVRQAILHNSMTLLDEALGNQGIMGLKKWRDDLINWKDLEDWKWACRLAYQMIEKRGTGGSGFRIMYADFLEEAGEYLPLILSRGLLQMMRELSAVWQELAMALKKASEKDLPEFEEVYEKIALIEKRETAYHQEAIRLKA